MPSTVHPRLYASSQQLQRLRQDVQEKFLVEATQRIAKDADAYVASTRLKFDPALHNALLLRAREMQTRVITLLVRWLQSGEERFRAAAIRDAMSIGQWEYWGWESWIAKNPRPDIEFDLSYGENSATLGIAYDWLFDTLSANERAEFRAIARKWSFRPFLFHARRHKAGGERRPWWFGHPSTNWNTVCCGGAGMLALAMYDEMPECAEVLSLVEESISPYLRGLDRTAGGWVEGIGYWNYGHRYAFMYLLSHCRAFAQPHPLLAGPGMKQTLEFPLDFSPNGQASGFGDVNDWSVLPFHYAAAVELGAPKVIAALDAIVAKEGLRESCWPAAAELLIFHPRKLSTAPKQSSVVVKHYPEMDWFILSDRMPQPRIYLSARGGTTKVPHSHCDLLSFHCVIGDEQLITNLGIGGGDEYLDTTFSSRRFELFEVLPPSKNTILINGVGIARDATVTSAILSGPKFKAIRMDATAAMGKSRGDCPAATFCGRLFVILDERMFVILDHTELPTPGRVESRMHTWQSAKIDGDSVLITGRQQRLRVIYAATTPAAAFLGVTCPTTPRPGANVLRWCTRGRTYTRVTMATVLSPGAGRVKVRVEETAKNLVLTISGCRIDISPMLNRVRVSDVRSA